MQAREISAAIVNGGNLFQVILKVNKKDKRRRRKTLWLQPEVSESSARFQRALPSIPNALAGWPRTLPYLWCGKFLRPEGWVSFGLAMRHRSEIVCLLALRFKLVKTCFSMAFVGR